MTRMACRACVPTGACIRASKSPTIPRLTLAWYAKPADTVYSRVTVGLLERTFGGVSGEVLWWPASSPLAIGARSTASRNATSAMLSVSADYEVTTGHVSAYYEFDNGIAAELAVGKYLAGDKGATVTLSREFADGWRVGAWVTKTDMSAEDFGEGSFDKGVTLSIPLGCGHGPALAAPRRRRYPVALRAMAARACACRDGLRQGPRQPFGPALSRLGEGAGDEPQDDARHVRRGHAGHAGRLRQCRQRGLDPGHAGDGGQAKRRQGLRQGLPPP